MITALSPLHLVIFLVVAAYLVASIWAIVFTVRDKRLRRGDKIA